MMQRRIGWLLLPAMLAACDSPTLQAPPAAPGDGPLASSGSTCAAPSILTAANGILSAQPVGLRFNYDNICRWSDQVEIYDEATGLRVVHDTSPEWSTYSFGSYFEYRNSSLQRGRYYTWRMRAYQKDHWGNFIQYSPWSGSVRFGVALLTPSVTGAIVGWSPRVSWPAVDGAARYDVYEAYHGAPGFEWDATHDITALEFTGSTCVTNQNTGHVVSYWVAAVSASGIRSNWTGPYSFSVCGVPPI